jgi:glycosyltransferase involved in cell wall biosynthesis
VGVSLVIFHFIYDGYRGLSYEFPFDPSRLCDDPRGLSGTEMPMFAMADELSRRGHDVTVYSRFLSDGKSSYSPDRTRFSDLDWPKGGEADIAIAFHDARRLKSWPAKRKVALHQSYEFPNERLDGWDFADTYLTATEACARYHTELRGKAFHVVPNCWDFGTYHPWRPIPGRIVFTTSVDRGAHRLLEVFPEIRKRVPGAHIMMLSRGSPGLMGLTSSDGVTLLPEQSRNQVLELLSTASVLAYPCDPPVRCEVFPMSVTEACAAGCPVVLAPKDQLEELFTGAVLMCPPVSQPKWQDAFVVGVTEVLTDPSFATHVSERGKQWALPFTAKNATDRLLEVLGV